MYHEELFGPVMPVTSFDDLDEAIALANDTSYGLAAYVFTNDLKSALRAAEGLEFGIVGVNEWAANGTEGPFTGWKQSGIGSESGAEGFHEYVETKLVSIGGIGVGPCPRSTSPPTPVKAGTRPTRMPTRRTHEPTRSLVVRVWLPDRPGALGAVASRIGGVGGDVHEIEVVDHGAGRAVDEFLVTVPEAVSDDLLAREIEAVDGVDVEELRAVDVRRAGPPHRRPGGRGGPQRGGRPAARAVALAERARHELRAVWAAVVGPDGVEAAGRRGPRGGLAAGLRHRARPSGGSGAGAATDEDGEVAWAAVGEGGRVLLAGRGGVPFRPRERGCWSCWPGSPPSADVHPPFTELPLAGSIEPLPWASVMVVSGTDLPPSQAADPSPVHRAFGFSDICGFTAYLEDEGPLAATRLVSAFRTSAREIAARRGVRIAKWLGDGVMFVSVEAGPLLATSVELTGRMSTTGLDLRSGVATGLVPALRGRRLHRPLGQPGLPPVRPGRPRRGPGRREHRHPRPRLGRGRPAPAQAPPRRGQGRGHLHPAPRPPVPLLTA